jgi:hypothetical protein
MSKEPRPSLLTRQCYVLFVENKYVQKKVEWKIPKVLAVSMDIVAF